MTFKNNHQLKNFFGFLVVANTILFLGMAYLHLLSTSANAAVFIDFWGRFTVYSMWFIGFALYIKYVSSSEPLRNLVLIIVSLNIPLFLLMAYFNQISNTPETIVFVDFWGRITVYSLWVLCYESYKKYVE